MRPAKISNHLTVLQLILDTTITYSGILLWFVLISQHHCIKSCYSKSAINIHCIWSSMLCHQRGRELHYHGRAGRRQRGEIFISPCHPQNYVQPKPQQKSREILSDISGESYTNSLPPNVPCSSNPWYLRVGLRPTRRMQRWGTANMQDGSHPNVRGTMPSWDLLQMFQASTASSLSPPLRSWQPKTIKGKGTYGLSLWSILYVCLSLPSIMGRFLILSGSHYRKRKVNQRVTFYEVFETPAISNSCSFLFILLL